MSRDDQTEDERTELPLLRRRDQGSSAGSLRSEIDEAQARARLFGAPGGGSSTSGPPTPEEPGRREIATIVLDDYVLLEYLGGGGMGEVFAAYDQTLDRKIAIKVLRTELWTSEAREHHRARLVREARALARVSHPNIVAVHRVGVAGERLYMALEYVDGCTLTQWLARRREDGEPGISEVLDVFVQAARGLQAAHEVGVVHRDLKPDNMLVDANGRMHVTDFGLARLRSAPLGDQGVPTTGVGLEPSDDELTLSGRIAGTPAYMAPEQWRGEPADARTDVFSLCVALHEAIYGQRPFVGHTLEELSRNVQDGVRRPSPPRSDVPRRLRAVLDRGLQVDPERRFTSMTELVDALERDPARVWSRRVAAAGVLATVAVVSSLLTAPDEASGQCHGADEELAPVWGPDARAALERRLLEDAAGDRSARVMAVLDRYAQDWIAMRTEACQATHERGVQSEALLDRRIQCLDDRRHELAVFVRELEEGPDSVRDRAVEAVYELSPIEQCRRPRPLVETEPPAQLAETIAQIREQLVEVRGLEVAGRYDAAAELARTLHDRARDLGWPPLEAEAAFSLARQRVNVSDAETAEALLSEVIWSAEEHALDRLKAEAKVAWIYVVGDLGGRPDEALDRGRSAEASVRRVDDPELEALYWQNLSVPLVRSEKLDEARAAAQRSLELYLPACETSAGPSAAAAEPESLVRRVCDDPMVLRALNNLAIVEQHARNYERARLFVERLVEGRRALYGSEHPEYALALNNLGTILNGLGAYEEARAVLDEALAVRKAALGAEHIAVAGTLNNLALVLDNQGRYEEALEHQRRAIAIKERVHGADHPDLGISLHGLGSALRKRGHTQEARASYERALAIFEQRLGREHPAVGTVLNSLGNVELDEGEFGRAETYYRRALEVWQARDHGDAYLALTNLGQAAYEQGRYAEAVDRLRQAIAKREEVLGHEHPSLVDSLRILGQAASADGRPQQAIEPLERALGLLGPDAPASRARAEIRIALARALVAARDPKVAPPERALDLARLARADFDATGAEDASAEVQAWLDRHAR